MASILLSPEKDVSGFYSEILSMRSRHLRNSFLLQIHIIFIILVSMKEVLGKQTDLTQAYLHKRLLHLQCLHSRAANYDRCSQGYKKNSSSPKAIRNHLQNHLKFCDPPPFLLLDIRNELPQTEKEQNKNLSLSILVNSL